VVLALACAGGAVAASWYRSHAEGEARSRLRDWTAAYGDKVVPSVLDGRTLGSSITGTVAHDLDDRLKRDLLAPDPPIERIRIWSTNAAPLFSTESPVSSAGPAGETAIREASRRGSVEIRDTSDTDGELSLYAPVRDSSVSVVAGVVEVDVDAAKLDADAAGVWTPVRSVAAGLGVFFMLLTLLTFAPSRRKRTATPEPVWDEVVADKPPRDRDLERMRRRLLQKEESHAALEVQLEQLRAQVTKAREEADARMVPIVDALEAAEAQLAEGKTSSVTAPLKAKIRELQQSLAASHERASRIESKMTDMASQTSENLVIAERSQAEAEAARARLAVVEMQAGRAESKLTETEARLTEAEAENKELRGRIAALGEELRWAQAQQSETHPIIQEATAKAREEKGRAERMLNRATTAEERLAATEDRARRAEERAERSEVGEKDAVKKAAGALAAEAKIARLEQSLKSARTRARQLAKQVALEREGRASAEPPDGPVHGEIAELKGLVAELRSRLEHTSRGDVPEEGPVFAHDEAVEAHRSEGERVEVELARALERAHAAEERGARLESELVALHRSVRVSAEPAEREGKIRRAIEEADGRHELESGEAESLRSRLAKTAARKKGHAGD
jgi:chromosome segregation ATPase